MFKKILVPLDGSNLAEGILPQVEELAKFYDAEVTLIRAVFIHNFPGTDQSDRQVAVVGEATEYLARKEADLKSRGIKVSTVVRYGPEAMEIVDHARDRGHDLIAMCTHGRTGLLQFFLGSVANKILHTATIPVLLYRAS